MRLAKLRLSVRLLMALVLVVGGWLGWYIRSVRLQATAVAAVKKTQGHIGYEWEYKDDQPIYGGKPWAPDWLVRGVSVDSVGSVVAVGMYHQGSDSDLAHIGHLKRLRSLNVIRATMTDDGLANLSGITGLRSLTLDGMPITDAGLMHLRLSRLRWLKLGDTQITDASLRRLEGLTELEYLDVKGTKVTDAGLRHLRGLTGLTGMSLENTGVTDDGLANLKGLTRLKKLWLGGSKVTPEGGRQLRLSLPGLRVEGVP